ncbi:MAG: PEGA domain-containing protein [Myxococcota bacterium]
MRRMLSVAAVLAAILAGSAVAQAAGSRVAVVVRGAGAGSDKPAGFVAHFLTTQLASDDRYSVVDVESSLGSRDAKKAERTFRLADDMIQKGRAAYESLDLDVAVDQLNGALAKYEQQVDYLGDMKKMADLLMLLGATHILRGEERLGARRLGQAVTLLPGVEPDPRIFNPAMRSVYDQAVREATQRPQGSLSLSSNPSYARVYVDGRFVGVTPLAVEGLLEGQHYVRMVLPGYRAWGEVVELPGRMEISEVGTLKPTAKAQAYDAQSTAAVKALMDTGDSESGPLPPAVEALATLLEAEALVLAEVRLDGERVQVVAGQFELKTRRMTHRARQVFAYDSRPDTYEREVRDMLQRHFNGVGSTSVADAEGDGGGDSDDGSAFGGTSGCADASCRRTRVWLLAGGVGGGTVLAGIGGLLLNAAYGDHDEFLATPQTHTARLDELRSSGRKKALAGDVLLVVGIAGAAASAGLAFLWLPTRGSSASADVISLQLVPLAGGAALSARATF